jgi:hypothetical protein
VKTEITIHKENNYRKSASVLVTGEQVNHLYIYSLRPSALLTPVSPLSHQTSETAPQLSVETRLNFHQHMLSNSAGKHEDGRSTRIFSLCKDSRK